MAVGRSAGWVRAAASTGIALGGLLVLWCGVDGATALTADDYVKKGAAHFAAGDFSSALDQYHSACDADPKAYMNFFKRATVYLATGRTNHAMKDLARVLDLKPELDSARVRLAELRVKDGSYAKAREDYKLMPKNVASAPALAQIDNVEALVSAGQQLQAAGQHVKAIEAYTQAIDISPQFVSLRMKRAACYDATGQYGQAVGDVSRAVKLKSGNVEGYYLLSRMHFKTGDRAEALSAIRECVKLDDGHKEAFKFYKMLKKFNKAMDKVDKNFEMSRFAEGITNVEKARVLEVENTFTYQNELNERLCLANSKLKKTEEAFTTCNATLALNPKNIEAMVIRSELWQEQGEFQNAIDDLKVADEASPDENNKHIKDKLARAEKLLKQSLKRDYYKILGLPRTCTKKEISKAYRNLAMEWHPDKHVDKSEEEQAEVEAKFMDIASAKEVLSDPKMRQQFDNGEDPLDAEQERERNQGGFNPFGGGQRFHFRHG